jgi:hypothetical protein
MIYHIQYSADTGYIGVSDNGDFPVVIPGLLLISREMDAPPDHETDKVDLTTLEIVRKSPDEVRHARIPSDGEVQSVIGIELWNTDGIISAGDRPPPKGTTREAWITYRQVLRDLSKQGLTPAEMVAAWPFRPNGADAIPHLRSRLQD